MQAIFKNFLLIAAAAIAIDAGSLPASADGAPRSNDFWWPERLDLSPLRQHDAESNPYSKDFHYAKEFQSLDLEAVERHQGRTDDITGLVAVGLWKLRAILHPHGLAWGRYLSHP
jgi:hypothetical protein